MKKLMVTIQKGGQGKTMLACHLAVFAAKHGLRVLFIDLDMQANSPWTLQQHASAVTASDFCWNRFDALPEAVDNIALVTGDAPMADADDWNADEALEHYRAAFERCEKAFDLCIIDTPPTLGFSQSATGRLVDYVVAPVEMEWYSIQGLEKLNVIISNLIEKNNKLCLLGIVPNRFDGRKPRLVNNLAMVRETYGDEILPLVVPQRDSISESLADPDMKTIWACRKTSARQPKKVMTELCAYLLKKMGFKKIQSK